MKKQLFISYSTENYNKVRLIIKTLENHPYFESLIVANKREPNKALIDKVTESIKVAYKVIPLLTRDSIKTQWVNQEIGYAMGINRDVIPIVEERIMDNLKGFIHKQNDLPYSYKAKTGLSMRDENKSFMICFRQLLSDLEVEYRKENKIIESTFEKKQDNYITLSSAHSIDPVSKASKTLFLNLRKPIGTIVKSGDVCQETGIYRSRLATSHSKRFEKGTIMPKLRNVVVSWRLIRYA